MRLLHAVSTAAAGHIRIGDLAIELGISQPTVTHHVQKLADVGFLWTGVTAMLVAIAGVLLFGS